MFITHTVVGSRDARTGLGYGVLDPKFQLPRSSNSSYPYKDADQYEDAEDPDEEEIEAIHKKALNYKAGDHFAGNKVDPLYFVAGNTKLSDCFWRTDQVLAEISAFGNSISPMPQVYKKKGPSITGYGPAFPYQGGGGSNYLRIGSLRGWSQKPPMSQIEVEMEDDEQEPEDEHIYSLRDLAKKLGDR